MVETPVGTAPSRVLYYMIKEYGVGPYLGAAQAVGSQAHSSHSMRPASLCLHYQLETDHV